MKKSMHAAGLALSMLAPLHVDAASTVFDVLTIQETAGTGAFLFFDNGFLTPNLDWGVLNDSNDAALTFGTFANGVLLGEPVGFAYGAPNAAFTIDVLGNTGLGTTTPGGALGAKLTISQTLPAISLDSGAYRWSLFGDNTFGMGFYSETNATTPFSVAAQANTFSLMVNSASNVGVGTGSPATKLHVSGTDGLTQLLVEETGPLAARSMFKIENNGPTRFAFENTDSDEQWVFNVATGELRIAHSGTGAVQGTELKIFRNGNATLAGTLVQNSDRNGKQDIQAVDHRTVLAKVMELPITEWSYKDAPASRHIGPMAQDFYKSFGLGDTDKGITSIDTGGVALAAIQGVKLEKDRQLAEKDREIAALKVELQQLRVEQDERIAEQDERMMQLEMTLVEVLRSQSSEAQVGSTN